MYSYVKQGERTDLVNTQIYVFCLWSRPTRCPNIMFRVRDWSTGCQHINCLISLNDSVNDTIIITMALLWIKCGCYRCTDIIQSVLRGMQSSYRYISASVYNQSCFVTRNTPVYCTNNYKVVLWYLRASSEGCRWYCGIVLQKSYTNIVRCRYDRLIA